MDLIGYVNKITQAVARPNQSFKDMFRTIIGINIIFILIAILLGIFFRNHFVELKESMDAENVIIMNQAKEILGDIYNVPIVIKILQKNRYGTLPGEPKKIYGNYIYDIYISEEHDKYSIYWELTDDIPEIKKIEKYASKETIYELAGTEVKNAKSSNLRK